MPKFGIFKQLSCSLRESILDGLEWYKYATLKQQHIVTLVSGAILGLMVGVTRRRRRLASGEFSENFELEGYKVTNVSEFEEDWNRLSRATQRQPGYKYTKLYKASYWDESPIHYLMIRLWRSKDDLDTYRKSQVYKQLHKKLETNTSKIYQDLPTVVLDDNVRRQIPF